MGALPPNHSEPDVAGDAGLDEEQEQTEGGDSDTHDGLDDEPPEDHRSVTAALRPPRAPAAP
jgi:hypothetical protein